ncbi:PcfB family protein [Petroclostridium sp. X23]|uniref:PcfB family protein n=1 Tax=Petroclostridium sp. X23 TaxID=3045146 RepID=UPI0024AD76EC|nr:PcfB family protein [Petroclostridium sp. X23]WHH59751.1 PcfB family protein [Petroclostridium sp. X23]
MNNGADAADQIVNMSFKGIEVLAKISGEGAKNLATYLYAVLKDQKKTRGKTRLEGLLRSGKELKVFAVKNEDLQKFTQEAKRYGVLYCALRDKNDTDGMCDIMVRAEDASKINRIVERFKLATVDTASIKSEIEKSRAAKEEEKTTDEKTPVEKGAPAEKSTDDFLDELMAKPEQPEPVKEQPDNPNPTTATTEKSHPSEPISERSGKAAEGTIEPPRRSVREELWEIKAAQKEQTAQPKREPAREQPKAAKQNVKSNRQQMKSKKPKSKAR